MHDADLNAPIFHDEAAAWTHFEKLRWEDGPVCPHCGATKEHAKAIKGARAKPTKTSPEGAERRGLYQCNACRKQFTATVGTVYERSHIPLHKWLLATHLMCASKKGISAAQLHRMLGFGSYRTAWFMAMRIRESMREIEHDKPLGGGGSGGIVEGDETYYGRSNTGKRTTPRGTMRPHKDRRPKRAIVALVERGGKARAFHVATADKKTVAKIVRENVSREARLHTDESNLYRGADAHAASHETVRHTAGEYVRGDVHTNSVEGFFGVFKRGMVGTFGHCSERHLSRYIDEFAFRHNTRSKLGVEDKERAARAVKGTVGKRLTLHQPQGA